ncbi:hypothetical protein R52603_05788 [Paraburkholderia saeva]|nr:hypothetical protein R52603_05788 [Paraburkholderia saeva]
MLFNVESSQGSVVSIYHRRDLVVPVEGVSDPDEAFVVLTKYFSTALVARNCMYGRPTGTFAGREYAIFARGTGVPIVGQQRVADLAEHPVTVEQSVERLALCIGR